MSEYDHWELGWERRVSHGMAWFTTRVIDVSSEAEASVMIEELPGDIPLRIVIEDEDTETVTVANLTPEQARELAVTLEECADILEGKK